VAKHSSPECIRGWSPVQIRAGPPFDRGKFKGEHGLGLHSKKWDRTVLHWFNDRFNTSIVSTSKWSHLFNATSWGRSGGGGISGTGNFGSGAESGAGNEAEEEHPIGLPASGEISLWRSIAAPNAFGVGPGSNPGGPTKFRGFPPVHVFKLGITSAASRRVNAAEGGGEKEKGSGEVECGSWVRSFV
jgi:hypothetical protein